MPVHAQVLVRQALLLVQALAGQVLVRVLVLLSRGGVHRQETYKAF